MAVSIKVPSVATSANWIEGYCQKKAAGFRSAIKQREWVCKQIKQREKAYKNSLEKMRECITTIHERIPFQNTDELKKIDAIFFHFLSEILQHHQTKNPGEKTLHLKVSQFVNFYLYFSQNPDAFEPTFFKSIISTMCVAIRKFKLLDDRQHETLEAFLILLSLPLVPHLEFISIYSKTGNRSGWHDSDNRTFFEASFPTDFIYHFIQTQQHRLVELLDDFGNTIKRAYQFSEACGVYRDKGGIRQLHDKHVEFIKKIQEVYNPKLKSLIISTVKDDAVIWELIDVLRYLQTDLETIFFLIEGEFLQSSTKDNEVKLIKDEIINRSFCFQHMLIAPVISTLIRTLPAWQQASPITIGDEKYINTVPIDRHDFLEFIGRTQPIAEKQLLAADTQKTEKKALVSKVQGKKRIKAKDISEKAVQSPPPEAKQKKAKEKKVKTVIKEADLPSSLFFTLDKQPHPIAFRHAFWHVRQLTILQKFIQDQRPVVPFTLFSAAVTHAYWGLEEFFNGITNNKEPKKTHNLVQSVSNFYTEIPEIIKNIANANNWERYFLEEAQRFHSQASGGTIPPTLEIMEKLALKPDSIDIQTVRETVSEIVLKTLDLMKQHFDKKTTQTLADLATVKVKSHLSPLSFQNSIDRLENISQSGAYGIVQLKIKQVVITLKEAQEAYDNLRKAKKFDTYYFWAIQLMRYQQNIVSELTANLTFLHTRTFSNKHEVENLIAKLKANSDYRFSQDLSGEYKLLSVKTRYPAMHIPYGKGATILDKLESLAIYPSQDAGFKGKLISHDPWELDPETVRFKDVDQDLGQFVEKTHQFIENEILPCYENYFNQSTSTT